MPKISAPSDPYHRSRPQIPQGLTPMKAWAESKGLSAVCVQRWIYAGRLTAYRVPGYGTRNFIKAAEAEALLKPVERPIPLAR